MFPTRDHAGAFELQDECHVLLPKRAISAVTAQLVGNGREGFVFHNPPYEKLSYQVYQTFSGLQGGENCFSKQVQIK